MTTRRWLLPTVMAWTLLALPAAAADWPMWRHDPQRSGWASDESTLTPQNVGGLEVKWKTQVKNQPHALRAHGSRGSERRSDGERKAVAGLRCRNF